MAIEAHMIRDVPLGFILVCGVIPLCLAVLTQINPWIYGKIWQ